MLPAFDIPESLSQRLARVRRKAAWNRHWLDRATLRYMLLCVERTLLLNKWDDARARRLLEI